jgi:hypothetical protein
VVDVLGSATLEPSFRNMYYIFLGDMTPKEVLSSTLSIRIRFKISVLPTIVFFLSFQSLCLL